MSDAPDGIRSGAGFAVSTAVAGARVALANAIAPDETLDDIDYELRHARTTGGLIWSKALAAGLADVTPSVSPGMRVAKPLWASRYIWAVNTHRKRPVGVYVNTYGLQDFFDLVLPYLTKPIVVVCGDSVLPVFTKALHARHLRDGFPRDRRIVAAFAQNLVASHPRAFPLPVGLDFHSIHRGIVKTWGMPRGQTPQAQEDALMRVRGAARPWPERSCAVYAQYTISTNLAERMVCQLAMDRLRRSRREGANLPRDEMWRAMAECQFVASPPGGGHDCHRTWEALALGSVPIVRREPAMSPLFADLPVWEVDDYSQVTDDTVLQKSEEIRVRSVEGAYDWTKLTVAWWREHLRATVAALKLPVPVTDGR